MMAAEEAKRRTNLGRGLSALLGEDQDDFTTVEAQKASKAVPIEFLKANPDQPRKRFDDNALDGLVRSIEENGILQPILVRQSPGEANAYEIVAGERRWRAAQRAKLHEVPVVIKELSDADVLEFALIENIQREDLTPLEEAEGYQRLIDEFSYTQDQLAKTLGKSRSHLANTLRLLQLPDEIKSMIDDGLLSAGHGRALVGVPNAEDLALIVIDQGLNVRQTEKMAQSGKGKDAGTMNRIRKAVERDPNVAALENSLTDNLGLKVSIAAKGETGKLTIQYDTLEQLDDVIARLSSPLNVGGGDVVEM